MHRIARAEIRLNPSADVLAFEAGVPAALAVAPDRLNPPGSLVVRSLYRDAADTFPPAYSVVLHTGLDGAAADAGVGPAVEALGATYTPGTNRELAGALPDAAVVLEQISRSLLEVTFLLPLRMIPEAFEAELSAALAGEVGVATRLNNVHAAFWTHDEAQDGGDPDLLRHRYVVLLPGDYLEPALRPRTVERITGAGGRPAGTRYLHHIATVIPTQTTPTTTPTGV